MMATSKTPSSKKLPKKQIENRHIFEFICRNYNRLKAELVLRHDDISLLGSGYEDVFNDTFVLLFKDEKAVGVTKERELVALFKARYNMLTYRAVMEAKIESHPFDNVNATDDTEND